MKYKKTIALSVYLLLGFYVEQSSFASTEKGYPRIDKGLLTVPGSAPMVIAEYYRKSNGATRFKAIDNAGNVWVYDYGISGLKPVFGKPNVAMLYGTEDYKNMFDLRDQMAQALKGNFPSFKYDRILGGYHVVADKKAMTQ